MASLDASTADALNTLLEDERASVEMEIAFANGATDLNEREAFIAMGGASIATCCALRDLCTGSGVDVSLRINGIVLRVLSLDRYDDRLRAFTEHLLHTRESVAALLNSALNDRIRAPLEELFQAQLRNAEWCQRRADAFAESRLLDFRTNPGDGMTAHVNAETSAPSPRHASDSGAIRVTSDPEAAPDTSQLASGQERRAGAPPRMEHPVDSDME